MAAVVFDLGSVVALLFDLVAVMVADAQEEEDATQQQSATGSPCGLGDGLPVSPRSLTTQLCLHVTEVGRLSMWHESDSNDDITTNDNSRPVYFTKTTKKKTMKKNYEFWGKLCQYENGTKIRNSEAKLRKSKRQSHRKNSAFSIDCNKDGFARYPFQPFW